MPEIIDVNLARGAVLILLIIAFLGIWAWAWSRKRKPDFHAASMLPLEEDEGTVPHNGGPNDRKNGGSSDGKPKSKTEGTEE